jgi:hypothetical protein
MMACRAFFASLLLLAAAHLSLPATDEVSCTCEMGIENA